MDRDQEYAWYVVGCSRLGQDPLPRAEFVELWQRYEDHAELLKAKQAVGLLKSLDAEDRQVMEQQIRNDPMLKAVLIGQSVETARPIVRI